ncbi:GlpG protein [Azomonas macrocytogenes]|uniref:GlpG protein n=1 Tax=Azomonas macrocytogenes TaxID=69962 RepID=A0A839T7A7_AZOMA|nr:GlpG protein [Azomonas macrocytogenes]
MTLTEALRLPLSEDLSGFLAMLQGMGVPCRVSEESDEQVVRVPAEVIGQVRELYRLYPQGQNIPETFMAVPPQSSSAGLRSSLRATPFTVGVLLVTLFSAVITGLGDNLEIIRWLNFVDFRIQGGYVYFSSLAQTLEAGQWWRLITPAFVHFGFLHLAMNSLWYWELGRRIESRQGRWMLLGLTLVFGVIANFAQYLFGSPGIFGGLSGVLYGLLGHCWLFQKLAPNSTYRLPPGVVGLMLAWLLICLSGIITVVSLGAMAIANAAHVGGLAAGCLTGVIGGLLARKSRHEG